MRVYQRLILLALLSPCFADLCLAMVESESSWTALPKGRLFRLTFADPREIRMGLAVAGNENIQAMVGNYFSLLSLRTDQGELWHLGVEGAGYFGMRQAEGRFPLETTDGLIGLYLEGAREHFQWQFRFTHISAHLSDGSVEPAIAFSRESLRIRAGWVPTPFFQAYAGANWITNSIPEVRKLGCQWGVNMFFPTGSAMLVPFLAADFQWKQESQFNPSMGIQIGAALNQPPEAYRSFRVYYSYFSGADFRGQFHDRRLSLHSLGIEMQI